MPRKGMWLWAGFGAAVCLVIGVFVATFAFVLGPWGPPPPWANTMVQPLPTTRSHTTQPMPVAPTLQAAPTQAPSIATPRGAPTPTLPPRPTSAVYPTPVAQGEPGEETARRLAETTLPARDLVAIASRLLYSGEPVSRTVAPDGRPYVVGRQDRFWIDDPDTERQREITATLKVVTPHLYMYVENGVPVNQGDLEEAANAFEETIYPTCRQAFGSEWTPGVDSDPHIVIVHARFAGAAGYFSSENEVPRRADPYSNQHEMFYTSTEMRVGGSYYRSTLAHEFQHLIHWSRDPQSDCWVDEGMAQMSEQINGFDASDISWAFFDNTDVQLTTWSDDEEENSAHYAASYLWFRYFTDRLGGTAVLNSLLDPNKGNIPAIEDALRNAGYQPAVPAVRLFDSFFADWALANYLDDPDVGDGRYAYDDNLELDPLWRIETVYDLPWDNTTTVYPYATDYVEVQGFGEGTLHISFDGAESLPLVDTTPHSGTHLWWSNRGDQADTTLTRAFDLSGVSEATLKCWLWYDIEEDYDYAYIEVSTDGGRSWQMLAGPHTTTRNPNGSNLGSGYTGTSGRRAYPRWVQETIDLSSFAGQEILLRFEMITDDAVNAPGLVVDDVEIPEIHFYDDVESDPGWTANGFVWTDNVVPLHFLVQIVTVDASGETAVRFLPLDANQQGEIELADFGSKTVQVALAISAAAPATTERATYHISLELE